MNNEIKKLLLFYNERKNVIQSRIKEFEKLRNESYSRLFEELCFCICTPQSKAVLADKAIKRLKKEGYLHKGDNICIRGCLGGVRFPNNKSKYIEQARNFDLKNTLDSCDDLTAREEIVKNVKGIGLKEASHFLRNIGRANELAILDVHILKNLKKFKVIKEIPSVLTKKTYLDIEGKMKAFSKKAGIPLRELDLLFWSMETGEVFK